MSNIIRALEALGFERWHTGGGCWAMCRNCGDGRHYVLVSDDDASLPTDDGPLMIGLYDGDGDVPGSFAEPATVAELLATAKQWIHNHTGDDDA